MSQCDQCGKEYTDDDMAMDEAGLPIKPACRYCLYWGIQSGSRHHKKRCVQLLNCGDDITEDLSSGNGCTLVTAPDFFCAVFKFKKSNRVGGEL